MKRVLFTGVAIAALGFGLGAAQACPGIASTSPSTTVAQPADTVTDISSAKKKKKKAMRKGGGASKAGTGGGAGGESGSGATSDSQQGKPRGKPSVR